MSDEMVPWSVTVGELTEADADRVVRFVREELDNEAWATPSDLAMHIFMDRATVEVLHRALRPLAANGNPVAQGMEEAFGEWLDRFPRNDGYH